MKEKIKKMFQNICTWKFVMWLNIVFVAYHIVGFLATGHAAYCFGIAWNAGYALMCYFEQKYDDRHTADAFYVVHMGYHNAELLRQLNLYKTRYGELPSGAPQTEASASKESEVEKPEAEPSSTAEVNEEAVAEPGPQQPSAVSKKPRNMNRKPRTKPSPTVKAEKPKRPTINPGKPYRTSSGTPRNPRTKKNKEEQ